MKCVSFSNLFLDEKFEDLRDLFLLVDDDQ